MDEFLIPMMILTFLGTHSLGFFQATQIQNYSLIK
ncbi:hypothetical protein ABH899_000848 [Paenibacillus sp. RC84]